MAAQLLWQHQQHKVRQIIFGGSGDQKLAGLRGMLFESHGHRQIPAGGRVNMRQLKRMGGDKREAEPAPSSVERRVYPRTDELASAATLPAVGINVAAQGVDEDVGGEQVARTVETAEDVGVDQAAASAEDAGNQEEDAIDSHHYTGDVGNAWETALEGEIPIISFHAVGSRPDLASKLLGALPSEDLTDLNPVQHCWDGPGLDLMSAENIYVQPLSANNAAFDAYHSSSKDDKDRRGLLLQYTVSAHHGVRAAPVVAFLKRLRPEDQKLVKFVFVVPASPPTLYTEFSWQPWLGPLGQVNLCCSNLDCVRSKIAL